MRVCSIPGCPNIYNDTNTQCPTHRRVADRDRGNRGYSSAGHHRFRTAVLIRDPICVICKAAPSTVADHYPLSRKELIERGLDPNDPAYGRGLDARCHNRETARNQPGGWNQ